MQPKFHTRLRVGHKAHHKQFNIIHLITDVTETAIYFKVMRVGNSNFKLGQKGKAPMHCWDGEWKIINNFNDYYDRAR